MPARMHHVSIFVRDMERSMELFSGILGMEIIEKLDGVRGQGISTLLAVEGFSADMAFLKHPAQKILLELVRQNTPAPNPSPATGGFGISLTVPDLDAAHARLGQEGWLPLSEPLEMIDPSGQAIRLFCFHTDEGMMVELIQQAK